MDDQPDLDRLIDVLSNSEDEDDRYEAAKYLADHPDARAIEALIVALRNGDDYVQFWAAYALGATKDARAVAPLCRALSDEEQDVREAAAGALVDVPDVRSAQSLVHALLAHSIGREALISIGPGAVPALLAALEARAHFVGTRIVLVETLGKIEDPRVAPALLTILNDGDEDPDVRESAGDCAMDLEGGRYYDEVNRALDLRSWMRDDDPFKGPWVERPSDEDEDT